MCPAGLAYSATLSLFRQDVTEILPKCQQSWSYHCCGSVTKLSFITGELLLRL